VALGLKKAGSSAGAALAFWLGNPILNPATMVFMGFVLGWRWVGLRALMALLLVFGVAYFVKWFVPAGSVSRDAMSTMAAEGPELRAGALGLRWLRAFGQLAVQLIPEYLVLVLLLGAARAWLFPTVTPGADGLLWVISLAIAGTLFVIPTAGEIPIVQTLMAFGLGVAPAAALLTTLPPVSLPSLVMLSKAFPARVLIFVGSAVVVLGLFSAALAVALGF
jgi:uncharacterized membrane protein YraQ (UPF0718 family)